MSELETQIPMGNMDGLRIEGSALQIDGIDLLIGIGAEMTLSEDPLGVGAFLNFTAAKHLARHLFSLGDLVGIRRFTCCHRYEPFWMRSIAGTRGGEVPIETQYLLAERENGNCVILVPLIDGAFRASLQGNGEQGLELVVESNDPAVVTLASTGLFIAEGENPYRLVEQAARSVMARMGTGRLRRDKPLPPFVDQFGWCTWDAFYQEVSHEKVREGLQSFVAGGIQPRLLILDDGWQSERTMPTGERRLTGFAANSKFPGDLAPTVQMTKQEFGIQTFLVWHALHGYWSGVDGEALPGYEVRSIGRSYSPGILHYNPEYNQKWWGHLVGVVPPEQSYRFYQDYHRHLRRQGVDGVKVDNQGAVEGVSHTFGGRVKTMQRYHEALEGAVQVQFKGNLINCMSCASEMLYSTLNSTLTRTSTDFWPNDPASHGLHLYVNAQVSLWFGEFVHPDWDMFQSGHAMGAYHAAGRAVGGCPVYVSDKPDGHDFELLRKLVLPDGSILRARDPGRPTRDCLFHDATREDVLLKIFNHNLDAGFLGAFNARYAPDDPASAAIVGTVSPDDVEGLEGERFAVYAHHAGELRDMGRKERWEITLAPLQFEIFTFVPIEANIAPIGLTDMFNSSAAIAYKQREEDGSYRILLRSGGRFLVWCASKPQAVTLEGNALEFTYEAGAHRLEVQLPALSYRNLEIYL